MHVCVSDPPIRFYQILQISILLSAAVQRLWLNQPRLGTMTGRMLSSWAGTGATCWARLNQASTRRRHKSFPSTRHLLVCLAFVIFVFTVKLGTGPLCCWPEIRKRRVLKNNKLLRYCSPARVYSRNMQLQIKTFTCLCSVGLQPSSHKIGSQGKRSWRNLWLKLKKNFFTSY